MDDDIEFPEKNAPQYFYEYDIESCTSMVAGITKSALADAVVPSLQLALISLLCAWMRSYCRSTNSSDSWNESQFMSTIGAMAYVLSVCETYVSFLLVFVLCNQLSWFFAVLGRMYDVQ